MLSILEQVNQFLWGFPLLALLAGAQIGRASCRERV